MKNQIVLLFILLCAASTWTACTDQKSKHRELLEWLNKNEGALFLSGEKSATIPDSTYIAILEKVSKANLALQQTDSIVIGKRDALTLLKQTIEFNAYLDGLKSSKKIDTKPIGRAQAEGIYNNYLDARSLAATLSANPDAIKKDKTESVLFTLPHIIKGFKDVYNPGIFTWGDTSWWHDKGLIIYPANYGSAGDLQGNNKWQSSLIVQLAVDVPDTIAGKDSWRVEQEKLFNYGDLEPPKLRIVNPNDSPK